MNVRDHARFADLVRALRRGRQMSQRDMARALGISSGYVGQWELGLSQPSPDVVTQLCRVFDLTDERYVQRLAFAERAPDWLRSSILNEPGAGTVLLSPIERRLLEATRRLPEAAQAQLVERVLAWIDGYDTSRGS